MNHRYTVRLASWQDDEKAIYRIRETVFVQEQSVDAEIEWDGLDAACLQALAEDENRDAIGTGRLHPSGKIGRIAVMPSWRGQGVGAAIMECLTEAARQDGLDEVYLHAQTYVVDFYARLGFVPEGEEFDEADIPHRFMRRRLAND